MNFKIVRQLSPRVQERMEKEMKKDAAKQAKEEVGAFRDNPDVILEIGGRKVYGWFEDNDNLEALIRAAFEFHAIPDEIAF